MTSTTGPFSPDLNSALKESTATWKRHLEELFYDAKSRFADVVWQVLDDLDEPAGGALGTKTLGKKKPVDLRAILGFARESNADPPPRYREVWGHRALIYSRTSSGFQLRHLSGRTDTFIKTDSSFSSRSRTPGFESFDKENKASGTPVRHFTPLRYTAFVRELLDIYVAKGGLGDFETPLIKYAPNRDPDWRMNKLRQDLLSMWRDELHPDTFISIVSRQQNAPNVDQDDQRELSATYTFKTHAFILASRSPFFGAALSRQKTSSRALTLPWTHFDATSFETILEYIYTGTLPAAFFQTADLSSVFAIWRGAVFLGIKTLPKLMLCRIITMLHGLCFSELDKDAYSNMTGGSWSRMISSGGCQCVTCRCWLPRVFEFSMASETQNGQLERGALRGLIALFGLGWCTPQFARLSSSQKLKDYIMLTLQYKVLTPRNALSLLFVAEEALNKIGGSIPSWMEPIREMILAIRQAIDIVLCEQTSECLNSDEWHLIRKVDALDVDLGIHSTTNPRKLAIIATAILRGVGPHGILSAMVYQAIDKYTTKLVATSGKGSVLQAHLHHLKTQLRNLMDDSDDPELKDLEEIPPSDSERSSIYTLSPNMDRPVSIVPRPASSMSYASYMTLVTNSPAISTAETFDPARQSSSIDALDLASISTYSHASSRTESTDYGLFYTRRAFSDTESIRTFDRVSNDNLALGRAGR